MNSISEKVADSYRQKRKPKANPGNKVTAARRKLYANIKERSGGNNKGELEYAMQIVRNEKPKVEKYVMEHNEVPADGIVDLATQAYNIRCREIDENMNALNISEPEALIFLEEDEAETANAYDPDSNDFVGHLFAPIGVIANAHKDGDVDNFIDPNLVSGIINTIGGKLDAASLKRAAQNKKPGIIGALTGGKSEYEAVRNYLQKPENADEKQAVLSGVIKDVSQLRGFGSSIPFGTGTKGIGLNVAGTDVIEEIARIKKREAIKKALPFIIIGLALIIFVTIYITKHANRNK